MAIRAVSLDWHGTVATIAPGVGAIYAAAAARHGIAIAPEALDKRFGEAFRATREAWPVPYGADEGDARDFWQAVVAATFPTPVPDPLTWELFEAFAGPGAWRLVPGARPALEHLARLGLPVAICSNFDLRLARLVSACHLPGVHEVWPSSLLGTPKPAPDLLLAAADGFGCKPQELLHVGDREDEDGGAAQAAGCAFLQVADEGLEPAGLLAAIDDPSHAEDRA